MFARGVNNKNASYKRVQTQNNRVHAFDVPTSTGVGSRNIAHKLFSLFRCSMRLLSPTRAPN